MTSVGGSESYGGGGSVVTIGNFDGVHRGHRALLAEARRVAAGGRVCAFTFDPAPRDVLRPDNGIPRIQRLEDRVRELGSAGADEVVVEPFDLALAARPPEWFAAEILQGRLRAAAVVVGHDFRFGRGRAGDPAGLRASLNCPVIAVDPVEFDGAVVSSSRVRELITAGQVAEAHRLLDRPHELPGRVVRGDGRGAGLGFPTANLDVAAVCRGPRDIPLFPAHGVYAVRASIEGGPDVDAVANLGVRPTFGGDRVSLEVHLLDGAPDLYGATLRIRLIDRLRGERRFSDREALMAQIALDGAEARVRLT